MADDKNMTEAQFNTIMGKLGDMDFRLDSMDNRLNGMDKHMVTKSDVKSAVFQGLAFAAACIIGTVVVVNVLGFFG